MATCEIQSPGLGSGSCTNMHGLGGMFHMMSLLVSLLINVV